jgi:pyrroloquinoline quinone biosynthesis protein E
MAAAVPSPARNWPFLLGGQGSIERLAKGAGFRYTRLGKGNFAHPSLFIIVTPSGKVLPCHAAETISGLEFWNVQDHSLADIWTSSPAFNAFRGTDYLPEPCMSCERREIDFGGCRCQAFALTGDARATDPVCHKSPVHDLVVQAAEIHADEPYHYRR